MASIISNVLRPKPLLLAAAVMALVVGTALADEAALMPQTKLHLTVVQWMPMKGEYQTWSALGGEFTISDTGTVLLPVIGPVPVGSLDSTGLAEEIATRLQAKTGMVVRPDTTVQVLEYPPIYVVGDVTNPGEHRYRSGMNVLQAVALSGGELRETAESSQDEVRLVGDLQGFDDNLLRSEVRIARLEAEMSGTGELDFPSVSSAVANQGAVVQIQQQERLIFAARANEIDRQTTSLTELRDLFTAEIGVLEEKTRAAESGIAAAEAELAGVKLLVEQKIAIASRQSGLERVLASIRAERLDQVTAIMRARQGIAEATRELDGLADKHRTAVASELQTEQASLEQLKIKREVGQKLLLDLLGSRSGAVGGPDRGGMTASIVRNRDGNVDEIAAIESTQLLPGDVIKVRFGPVPRPRPARLSAAAQTTVAGAGTPR